MCVCVRAGARTCECRRRRDWHDLVQKPEARRQGARREHDRRRSSGMIDEADRDGDGEVSEEEFIRIMKKTSLD